MSEQEDIQGEDAFEGEREVQSPFVGFGECKVEVEVRAPQNGRELTLDPLQEVIVDVPWREVKSIIPCGFQLSWIGGDYDGERFLLTSGAEVGSSWATFRYKGRYFCIDAKEIVAKLVAIVENDTKKDE